MENEKLLLENAREFLKEAKKSVDHKSYNSAVTLYFKALAVLIDLFILKKEGFIPSNHNNRFRLLEIKYPLLYKILDKDFPVYQQSYKLKLNKDYVKIFEDDIKKIIEFTGIKLD